MTTYRRLVTAAATVDVNRIVRPNAFIRVGEDASRDGAADYSRARSASSAGRRATIRTRPTRRLRISSCSVPLVLKASPPSITARPFQSVKRPPASSTMGIERGAIPRVHARIEHDVGTPGGNEAVPIAIAPPALQRGWRLRASSQPSPSRSAQGAHRQCRQRTRRSAMATADTRARRPFQRQPSPARRRDHLVERRKVTRHRRLASPFEHERHAARRRTARRGRTCSVPSIGSTNQRARRRLRVGAEFLADDRSDRESAPQSARAATARPSRSAIGDQRIDRPCARTATPVWIMRERQPAGLPTPLSTREVEEGGEVGHQEWRKQLQRVQGVQQVQGVQEVQGVQQVRGVRASRKLCAALPCSRCLC